MLILIALQMNKKERKSEPGTDALGANCHFSRTEREINENGLKKTKRQSPETETKRSLDRCSNHWIILTPAPHPYNFLVEIDRQNTVFERWTDERLE